MYKSLYRIYRPKIFEDVIGQELVLSALKNSIKENKINHAYLFFGASGIGKTTLAKIFSMAINCLSKDTNKPCLVCETCMLITENKTTDVVEMDAATNNGVEQIRSLIENVKYPPLNCRYKVYIIDEVHMLSNSAFNALLKTLEEPPKNIVFILVTTEDYKIPETILTRCQKFSFEKPSNKDITKLLQKIAIKENANFDDSAIKLISDLSNGGIRKSIGIIEKCINLGETITVDLINKIHKLLSTSDLCKFMLNLKNKNSEKVFDMIQKIHKQGINYSKLMEEILFLSKEILLLDIIKDEKYTFKYINPANKEELIKLGKPFVLKVISHIKKTISEMKFSSKPWLYFEVSILEIINFDNNSQTKLYQNEETKSLPITVKSEINVNNPIITKKEKTEANHSLDNNETSKSDSSNINKSLLKELEDEEKNMLENVKEETEESNPELENSKPAPAPVLSEQIKLENEIINILVRSEKSNKESFKTKWDELKKYSQFPELAKWVSMIIHSELITATTNVLLILFEHEPSANILNASNRIQEFNNFTYQIFEKDILIVGVWNQLWKKIKENFKYKKLNNTLPIYQEIIIPKANLNKEEVKSEEIKKVESLFDDIEVEIT